MASLILFFVEDIEFEFKLEKEYQHWLQAVAKSHGATIHELNYIFVSDQYLLKLNQNYLNHDTLTDIITFPYDADNHVDIGGDVYISIERVRENAEDFKISFEDELARVVVHGLLHLVGFEDKTKDAKQIMTKAEDAALAIR